MGPRAPHRNDGGPAIIEATHEAAHEEDGNEGPEEPKGPGPVSIPLHKHVVPADLLDQPGGRPRIDTYCVTVFGSIASRKAAQKALKRADILLNGLQSDSSRFLSPGDVLTIVADRRKPPPLYELAIHVHFEDEHLAVVSKPAGLITNGARFRTLEHTLPYNLRPSGQPDALPQPSPVHRLDSATSGLIVVAKTGSVYKKLGQMFENKSISKRYRALVVGKLALGKGEIRTEMEGRHAHSTYEALSHTRSVVPGWLTTVDLVPVTGRTHQLRKHMAHLGTPILGDTVYGSDGLILKKSGLFLCSLELNFIHPITGVRLHVLREVPRKFERHCEYEQHRWDYRGTTGRPGALPPRPKAPQGRGVHTAAASGNGGLGGRHHHLGDVLALGLVAAVLALCRHA